MNLEDLTLSRGGKRPWPRPLLTAGLLLAACRPGPSPGPQAPIPLQGMYAFEGRVHGRNQYRYRGTSFTREIRGTVDFEPDVIRVYYDSDVPACVIPREKVRFLAKGHVAFECPGRLEFAEGWGQAVVPVTEEREEPRECSQYEILPDGRRGRCLEWIWVIRERTTWKTAPLTIRRIGGNPP